MNYEKLIVDIERMIGLLEEKSISPHHIDNLKWLREKYIKLGTKVPRNVSKDTGE